MNKTYCIVIVSNPTVLRNIPTILEIKNGMINGVCESYVSILYHNKNKQPVTRTMLFDDMNEIAFTEHMTGDKKWLHNRLMWLNVVLLDRKFKKIFIYKKVGECRWDRTDLTQIMSDLKSIL